MRFLFYSVFFGKKGVTVILCLRQPKLQTFTLTMVVEQKERDIAKIDNRRRLLYYALFKSAIDIWRINLIAHVSHE